MATDSKGLATVIFPVAKGEVLPITEVNDEVFSQKMMGDGYAVNPSTNTVVSPVDGTIQSVFPTKHAIGIKTASGIEVLIHLGIDTVELEGEGFETFVEEGQEVIAGDKIAEMDLASIKKAGKDTTIMVVFTNLTENQDFELIQTHDISEDTEIGRVK
ncbi:PTS glucose transporter subunit IIA [Globicatella sulfidifaciens]|uniref:PTS glucose transporter subunit IIA n=1 Tax=Globicatella sulfidifaciens TaxID=136093 RepID=A0A7X8H027_9LACT|nr:PTS glucose transporter subunit IIA [Globicatella sulfidifaciens]NLJ18298.1 PTS glucose transporter subunit IIA [Globicatella sulfidifaciens]